MIIALAVSGAAGLFINYRVDANWIAPAAMVTLMALLMSFGRIPSRRRRDEEDE